MALLTVSWCLDFMVLVVTVIFGSYLYMTRKFSYWRKRGVMEIPPVPFFGNFADCLLARKSSGEVIKNFYEQSANLPYMGFYIFDTPFLLVRDPELVKCVLVRDFNYFADRFATAHDDIGSKHIFFVNNPAWKLIRTKLTPTYTSGKLKKMFEIMLEVGEDLKTYLNSLNLEAGGQVMEIKDLCANYATDIIGATAFGLHVNSLNNPNVEFRNVGRDLFKSSFWRGIELISTFVAPQFIKLMGFEFFTKSFSKVVRKVFWDTADERKRSGHRRNDLIDRLMDIQKNEANSPDKDIFEFDGDQLVAQAAAFFAAAFETVSSAISFTLYELAVNPNLQTKLRREIKDALENTNNEITYDLVLNLPYLDMVVSETLRMYPALPFLDRVTNADYKVPDSNLVLEKGTPVLISMIGLHYDPEYFPDPKVFDPDRFTEENKRNRNPFAFVPFGEGPRSCIGMRFALLETKLALIQILTEYELVPCEKTLIPMRLDPSSLFTTATGGLYLKIQKLTTLHG